MALINTTTYTGKVSQALYSNLIFGMPTIKSKAITPLTGVTGSIKVPQIEAITGSPQFSCTPVTFSPINLENKIINVSRRAIYIKECLDQFVNLFDNAGIFEPSGNAINKGMSASFQDKLVARVIAQASTSAEMFLWNASSVSVDPNYLVANANQNGLVSQITADVNVIKVAPAGFISATTILGKLAAMHTSASPLLIDRSYTVGDVYFYLPAAYRQALILAFSNNIGTLSNSVLGLNEVTGGNFTYLGIPIIFSPAIPSGTFVSGSGYGNNTGEKMYLTFAENLFMATDNVSDIDNVKIINLSDYSENDQFLIKGSYFMGSGYSFSNRIVAYSV